MKSLTAFSQSNLSNCMLLLFKAIKSPSSLLMPLKWWLTCLRWVHCYWKIRPKAVNVGECLCEWTSQLAFIYILIRSQWSNHKKKDIFPSSFNESSNLLWSNFCCIKILSFELNFLNNESEILDFLFTFYHLQIKVYTFFLNKAAKCFNCFPFNPFQDIIINSIKSLTIMAFHTNRRKFFLRKYSKNSLHCIV